MVAKRDRLARDVVIATTAERLAEAKGARIMSADGLRTEGPEGQLMRTLVDAFAAYERALIRSRIKAALAVKKTRGERVGMAPIGFGVCMDGRRLVESVPEQRALGRIYELRRCGTSIRAIAAQLNAEGIPARGERWHHTSVARVLERAEALR